MENEETAPGRKLKSYLAGFVLALVLTAIPFGVVAANPISRQHTLIVIAIAAILQVLVHLRYFLHLGLRSTPPERLLALAFAAVLVLIMIGGSLWIMFNLHYRMWV